MVLADSGAPRLVSSSLALRNGSQLAASAASPATARL
jgi:hypothetical protein